MYKTEYIKDDVGVCKIYRWPDGATTKLYLNSVSITKALDADTFLKEYVGIRMAEGHSPKEIFTDLFSSIGAISNELGNVLVEEMMIENITGLMILKN